MPVKPRCLWEGLLGLHTQVLRVLIVRQGSRISSGWSVQNIGPWSPYKGAYGLVNSRPDAARWLQIEGCCNAGRILKLSGQLVAFFHPRAGLGGKIIEPANFYFSTENDWGVDSQNSTEISVQLKTEMESSRQRGDFDAKTSGSSSNTSLVSSQTSKAKDVPAQQALHGQCE